MRRFLITLAAVAMVSAVVPAAAEYRDVPGLLAQAANRYVPSAIGVPVDRTFVFGPYVIPPGQDSNRITVDVPIQTGFITAIAPDLVDASSGRIPTQQEAHIHHAHWFRVTDDPDQEYYTSVGGSRGLSWVFGTGEEKTQGRLDDRARLDQAAGNNWDYGMEVDGTTPNAIIFMIHNKLPSVGRYMVVLDVTFVPGTETQIEAVTGRPLHTLYGQLWGQTKDVTDQSKGIGKEWTVTRSGVAVAAGGHLHPGGKNVIVSNLGKNGVCRGVDPDGDGFDGVAILNSYKYDRDMRAAPYSEEYQMGATKFGWRAPLHQGDILRQDATYAVVPGAGGMLDTTSRDGIEHNHYEAMSYTGIYMDREQTLGTPADVCSIAALGPQLLGANTFALQGRASSWDTASPAAVAEIQEDWDLNLSAAPAKQTQAAAAHGMVNHIWRAGDPEPLCAQAGLPALAGIYPPCGPAEIATSTGPLVDTIHAAGFLYAPGDLGIGATPMIPQVKRGTTLTLVNDDVVGNIRHTFTSCAWPCVGTYVSNFPNPSGGAQAFDTGKIGNIDPIDGGITGDDTVPLYRLNVTAAKFPIDGPTGGKFAYFCRIHPFMRGAFQVVA